MSPYQRFIEARDFLLQHRTDYEHAYHGYITPALTEFNWALDYFDVAARGNDTPALRLVGEDGSDVSISYAEMALRSNRVANWLRELGVQRGDRVLLMLPNRLELWELMLALIKLGAVMVPTSMLAMPSDLDDRFARGQLRHIIAQSSETAKFAGLDEGATRIAVGAPVAGWRNLADSAAAGTDFVPIGVTMAHDPLLLYFTSGTTARPKLVLHSHESYPVGHLSTMYWIGLKPGDVHWNIS